MTSVLPISHAQNSPTHSGRTRILLDVTISATTKLNTGIQRVVRNIAKNAELVSDELDVECVPVVCHGDQLSPVGFDGRARIDTRILRAVRDGWMAFHKGIAGWLSKLNRRAGDGYLATLSRLRKLLVPKTLVRGIGNAYRSLTGQTIQFSEGDVLVLLDASWDLPLDQFLNEAAQNQIPVVTVVYDLIPVLHPQFHPPQLRDVFTSWLENVVDHSSLMVGISKTVEDDLAEFIHNRDLLHGKEKSDRPRLDHFRLGSDFSETGKKERTSSFGRGIHPGKLSRYYLTVGTLEPRKNHSFLLDAFEKLWLEGAECQLVIAGKIGWMCDEMANRIHGHPMLNQKLFFVDDASDTELDQLYRNAEALVFPSIVEGFGLPIVEAFERQLPVLASDTRIHREVAQDEATYFSLDNPTELASLIHQVESGERQLVKAEKPLTTWEHSCRDLLGKICDFVFGRDHTNQSRQQENQEEFNSEEDSSIGNELEDRRLAA